MSDYKETLLPPASTSLAKVLDVLEDRLFRLPVEAISKDPQKVDPALLDHLAWEVSVDVWGHDIPLETRRRIVEASPDVHRHKGTVHGLREALKAFGWSIEIEEWWQQNPAWAPGTFRVTVFPFDGIGASATATAENLTRLRDTIRRVAPVSRGFDVQMKVVAKPKVFAGATSSYLLHARNVGGIPPAPTANMNAKFGVATLGHIQVPPARCERIAA